LRRKRLRGGTEQKRRLVIRAGDLKRGGMEKWCEEGGVICEGGQILEVAWCEGAWGSRLRAGRCNSGRKDWQMNAVEDLGECWGAVWVNWVQVE